ncbi:hypothetical protein FKP32DRAFT_1133196 [Trametes sanguinea]|nr:hypothetical protein FKP32DRAFT_1133196 [Trametes sanguinea]
MASRPHDNASAVGILDAHGIGYVYWYEYALRHHGSTTMLFSLYLLVDSVPEAKSCLESAGWSPSSLPRFAPQYYDPDLDEAVVLSHVRNPEEKVVLMSAGPWPGISPTSSIARYPSLSQLYNALAQRALDTESLRFRQYLHLQLAYLYEDCAELASSSFVGCLPRDIQQYHLDWRSGTLMMGNADTIRHERAIRERARSGDWELMYQGTAALGGTKIDRAYEASLLKGMAESAAS